MYCIIFACCACCGSGGVGCMRCWMIMVATMSRGSRLKYPPKNGTLLPPKLKRRSGFERSCKSKESQQKQTLEVMELYKQHNASPSIYSEFQDKGLCGMQHMGVITTDLDADLAKLKPLGITPVQWGTVANGMRFAYVSSDYHPGAMIELIEANEGITGFFQMMKDTAQNWDGKDPIRRL